jgi:hypothetical protein
LPRLNLGVSGLGPDLTGRWSGIIAATPELAEEMVDTIRAGLTA